MKFVKFFFITLVCFALISCNFGGSVNSKVDKLSNKMGEQEIFRIEQGAGAVHATKKILDESSSNDIYTESARKTIDIANKSLPPLSIVSKSEWDKVAESLILGSTKELEAKEKQLIKSEQKQADLKKKLEKAESERLAFYERLQKDAEIKIAELKRDQALKKQLMMYFAGAAVLCVIGSAVLGYFLGMKVAINGLLAGGFFGLASYLITLNFFGYIAAAFAVVMFVGTGYYIWGRLRPEKTMAKTADVIEKMLQSPEGHKRSAAELVKKEISSSLTGKEGEAHKKYIKHVKKKL